jgi:hypothetical protein
MEQTKKGYVYILTNPSFKEGWVKIGKTSKTVEQRVKDLDGTAVPLPFVPFASVRTSKYSELERVVHETFDKLTELRIRQKREFFNINPDDALTILKRFASLLDDAEIKEYPQEATPMSVDKPSQGKEERWRKYWTEFIQYCKENGGLYADNAPVAANYIVKSIKVPYGVGVNAVVGLDFIRIEIYFNNKDKELNKQLFDYLYDKKSEIETEYGSPLIWEKLPDKTACRIKVDMETRPFEIEDRTELFEFMKEASSKLSVIFHNYIMTFKKD